MKKFLLLVILCFSVSLAASAQSKINPAGRLQILQYQQSIVAGDSMTIKPMTTVNPPIVTAMVELDSETTGSVFDASYIEVISSIGKTFIIHIPIDKVETLALDSRVVNIEFGNYQQPMLDYARPSGNVNQVQSGFTYEGKTRSFDGTGVICGMMDTGLEANHINFKNSDGSSRIQRLWVFTSNNGTCDTYTPSNISTISTDNNRQSHATHVAGIIGGSYKGNGTYNYCSGPMVTNATMRTDQPIPYYGVATSAQLAFSVGELYDANIIQGVKNIVEYAESQGKRAVINMSLGSNSGPHDGTDTYTATLSELGKRAIICMSAGNEGDTNLSITKKFTTTASGKILRTFINESKASGVVDIWASDSQPLTVTWALYDKTTQTLTPIITSSAAGTATTAGTDFTTYYNGSIQVTAAVNAKNNRYNVYSYCSNVSPKASSPTKFIALTIEGTSGQTVYLFGNSNTTFSNRYTASAGLISGYTAGSATNSINNAACGSNILSVGAYVTRGCWGVLSGGVYGYFSNGSLTVTEGNIASFSSYGTSFQGKQLPLVCAPGQGMVSSYSQPYIAAGNASADLMVAKTTSGSNTYYWGNMQGTSMSCPFVTGTVGLWLQADPTLDYDKVMEVINNTSSPQLLNAERWGAGKLDALKGMQYVLANKVALGTVWADDAQRLIITPTDGGYEIFVADTPQGFTATLVDLQGRPVARIQSTDSTATLSTSALSRGIYILSITTAQGLHLTHKLPL